MTVRPTDEHHRELTDLPWELSLDTVDNLGQLTDVTCIQPPALRCFTQRVFLKQRIQMITTHKDHGTQVVQ